jgi:hypothetical protein
MARSSPTAPVLVRWSPTPAPPAMSCPGSCGCCPCASRTTGCGLGWTGLGDCEAGDECRVRQGQPRQRSAGLGISPSKLQSVLCSRLIGLFRRWAVRSSRPAGGDGSPARIRRWPRRSELTSCAHTAHPAGSPTATTSRSLPVRPAREIPVGLGGVPGPGRLELREARAPRLPAGHFAPLGLRRHQAESQQPGLVQLHSPLRFPRRYRESLRAPSVFCSPPAAVRLAAGGLAARVRLIWLGRWPAPLARWRSKARWGPLRRADRPTVRAGEQDGRTVELQAHDRRPGGWANRLAPARPASPAWIGDWFKAVESIGYKRYGFDLDFVSSSCRQRACRSRTAS